MSKPKTKKCNPKGETNSHAYFVAANPPTSFNPISVYPEIHSTVFISPFSSIIGDITIDKNVFIGCNATLRADEGTPFYIGSNSNIQDGVILHGLEHSQLIVNGKKYSIYIGDEVSIAHGALIHGPSIVGNRAFVGFNAIVFNAIVEDGCYIDINAIVTGRVRLRANSYVPIGAIIDTQEKADALGEVTEGGIDFAKKVIEVNKEFSTSYSLNFGEIRCSCGLCCNSETLLND